MAVPEQREWTVEVIWTSSPGIPRDRIVDGIRARSAGEAADRAAKNWPDASSITVL
ncbi:hypothetical protein ABZ234_07875 [Nocardiopsis sp. NPDC006198]|uniref:hypothetical protein n=1 Tax=Nocardiopsis sp. NPDC006198 TaxID=3154472 RepID=UPI00339F8DB3